jgi:hypothetical protein
MASLLIALAFLAAPEASGFSPEACLRQAMVAPATRLEILELQTPAWPRGCVASSASIDRAVATSGRYAVKLTGSGMGGSVCVGWAWARVRVSGAVLAASRALKAGDPLAGATVLVERELKAGRMPLTELPEGALAGQSIAAGQLLEAGQIHAAGPPTGDPLTVVARSGSVLIAQQGRAVPCARGRTCAQLSSGRRVEGRLEGGRLVVEVP